MNVTQITETFPYASKSAIWEKLLIGYLAFRTAGELN